MNTNNAIMKNIVGFSQLTHGIIKMLFLFSLVLSSGCAELIGGAIAGSIGRSIEKDSPGSYSELKALMTNVPSGSGRLFVYMTDGGRNPLNYYGAKDYCTIDDQVFNIFGKTFWYTDLQPGTHKVTAGDVNGFFPNDFHYGKNSVDFALKDGEIKYCLIDLGGFGAFSTFTPTMVDAAKGEQELADLDFYGNYKLYLKLK